MGLLSFFSNLIIFTFGLLVLLFWLAIIVIVVIELWDLLTGRGSNSIEEEQ